MEKSKVGDTEENISKRKSSAVRKHHISPIIQFIENLFFHFHQLQKIHEKGIPSQRRPMARWRPFTMRIPMNPRQSLYAKAINIWTSYDGFGQEGQSQTTHPIYNLRSIRMEQVIYELRY